MRVHGTDGMRAATVMGNHNAHNLCTTKFSLLDGSPIALKSEPARSVVHYAITSAASWRKSTPRKGAPVACVCMPRGAALLRQNLRSRSSSLGTAASLTPLRAISESRFMNTHIQNFAELQQAVHDALREQHPEWLGADGSSPSLQLYSERFAWLLAQIGPAESPLQVTVQSLAA